MQYVRLAKNRHEIPKSMQHKNSTRHGITRTHHGQRTTWKNDADLEFVLFATIKMGHKGNIKQRHSFWPLLLLVVAVVDTHRTSTCGGTSSCHHHHAVISSLIALEQIQKCPRPVSTDTADEMTLLQFMPPTCTCCTGTHTRTTTPVDFSVFNVNQMVDFRPQITAYKQNN